MQTLQQTMAHRGAGMTRTHARWHPYTPPRSSVSNTPNYANFRSASLPSACASSSQEPDASYLITPASTVYSISPSATTFASSPSVSLGITQQSSRIIPGAKPPSSLSSKPPFVASLVDQAVKSLTEIWQPEIVPQVFCTSTQVSLAETNSSPRPPLSFSRGSVSRKLSLQLPSPCSPSTQLSPPSCTSVGQTASFFGDQYGNDTVVTERELVPIRTYVHEMLRRSRTTCSVLQSALCYIEALRKRVPELAEIERSDNAHRSDVPIEERIEVCETSWQAEASSNSLDCPTETMSTDTVVPDSVQTVMQDQTALNTAQAENNGGLKKRKGPSKPLPPLPPLPSPLLCPRRAFLAALILASKFLQDRCYSNRAWAKLSGLAPREVSRCERALGEALEWRLWVGKTAVPESFGRSIARSRSESTILLGTPMTSEAVYQTQHIPSPPLSDDGASPELRLNGISFTPQDVVRRVGFSRSKTLPDILANHHCRMAPPPPLVLPPPACTGISDARMPNLASFSLNAQGVTSLKEESATVMLSAVAAESTTPRLSYSPQSLVEPNLDTPSTQYSSAWSPARSTGSNDSLDGHSPSYYGAFAPFTSLDSKVAECMTWPRPLARNLRMNVVTPPGFDAVFASGHPYQHPSIGQYTALSMLDFAPQAVGMANFSQV